MTWKIIGKTDWGEPVLRNEYGCILEGGCGNAPDGHQCGECYGKDGCPVLKDTNKNARCRDGRTIKTEVIKKYLIEGEENDKEM